MKFSNQSIPYNEKHAEKLSAVKAGDGKISQKLPCRDPYVLLYGDKYYLYKTGEEKGILCLVSDDLENWSEPVLVFKTPDDFHGYESWYWAPECHYYKGYFYIFTSVKSKKFDNHRTISVYRADNPLGPFEDIAGGRITPDGWDAIDGTLYIDRENRPWMVFVHEWTSMPDGNGGMCAARLSEDFTHFISEPICLFYAKDPDWARFGVTDGPYPFRTKTGKLMMIWSNFGEKGYVVGLAESDNGEIDGKWSQAGILYERGKVDGISYDGGHGMLLQTKEGNVVLSMHAPNDRNEDVEHVVLLPIKDLGDTIEIG